MSLVTRGFVDNSSDTDLLLRGFAQNLPTFPVGAAFVTRGFGTGSTPALLLRRFFTSYLGLPQIPPTGTVYQDFLTLPPAPSADSVVAGAVPAVQNLDVWQVPLVDTQAYPIVPFSDGTFQILVGSNTARQDFPGNIWSAKQLFGFYGSFQTYVNDIPPIQTAPLPPQVLTLGVAMTPLDLSLYVMSVTGDPLVYAIVSGVLPSGVTLSGSVISGTPSTQVSSALIISVTDLAGGVTDLTPLVITFGIAPVPFPTIQATIIALSAAGFVASPVFVYAYSLTVPDGYVISINPVPGSDVPVDTPVQLTVSLGLPNPVELTIVPNVVGKLLLDAQRTLVLAGLEAGNLSWQYQNVRVNAVLAQSLTPGTTVALFSQVDLVFNAGPPVAYPGGGDAFVPPLPSP